MAALDTLTIKGFKSFESLEAFKLNNLNVLIGANGSGKSNFVDFFRMISAMMKEDGLKEFVAGDPYPFLFGGPKKTKEIEVNMRFAPRGTAETRSGYSFKLAPTENNIFLINDEKSQIFEHNYKEHIYEESSGNTNPSLLDTTNSISIDIKHDLRLWKIYHFHDTSKHSGMRRRQSIEDNEKLRIDGENIAPFLRRLREDHRSVFDEIVETIQLVLPYFKKFSLKPDKNEKVRLDWKQKGLKDYPMRPSQLSDGAIRFICLATALLQPNPPSTIIIDEPELGLHPYAIEILAELIQAASERMQVIVSTQSPTLVDYFSPEDVVVVNRVKGATTLKRLIPEELASWLESYSLGELWQKNVLLGGPSHE